MRNIKDLKREKGVAGTTIFLGLIVSLFVIGLLIMIFALMGGSLRDATYDATGVTVTNETGGWVNATTFTVDNAGALGFTNFVVTAIHNNTDFDGELLLSGNYTVGATGTLINASVLGLYDEVNVSYTYTYNAENTATETINDTTVALSSATDFFDLFIVIGAMVVLILLTVIIIVAIRQSGMMAVGGTA